ncbi:MAG: hypothetical protein PUB18_01190 [bacterium]|nr:hypothetical protein [bacterium]
MKNSRGFTGKGLLVIVVVLIIIVGFLFIYFYNQRKRNFITMAKDYITEVRVLATSDRIILPATTDDEVLITISQIEPTEKLRKSPFHEKWNLDKSYVVIRNIGTEYSPRYIYLIALEDKGGHCVSLTEEVELHRNKVSTQCSIEEHDETAAIYLD